MIRIQTHNRREIFHNSIAVINPLPMNVAQLQIVKSEVSIMFDTDIPIVAYIHKMRGNKR